MTFKSIVESKFSKQFLKTDIQGEKPDLLKTQHAKSAVFSPVYFRAKLRV